MEQFGNRAKTCVPEFSPEFRLLLACCGRPVRETQLAELLRGNLDWDKFLALTEDHRVLPAVHGFLADRTEIPLSIKLAMHAKFIRHNYRVLRFCGELTAILRQFKLRRIRVIAHKGPMLAQELFGDVAMRQFGDLDFLLCADDVGRAKAALAELGFTPNLQLTKKQEQAYLGSGYELVFGSQEEKNLIELQWRILPRFYSVEFDMEALFRRSKAVQFGEHAVRVLGNEDLLLVLCVHAAKHQWEQLGMLRDLAASIRVDMNWAGIWSEAKKLGIAKILGISLLLARNFVGCEIPDAIESKIESHSAQAEKLVRAFAIGRGSEESKLRYLYSVMQMRERWRDRMRFAWRLAVTPSVGDFEAFRIPDSLFPLYRGVRPIRLLRKLVTQHGTA